MKKIKEECGVFGIYTKNSNVDVVMDTYTSLYALQHRGQESCGISVCEGGSIRTHKDLGLVPDVFNRDVLDHLGEGKMAVGHVRYSTTGSSSRINAQPLVVSHIRGPMALAHNGNLVNAGDLRRDLELSGAIFHTSNDTEVISYLITEERIHAQSMEEALALTMPKLQGAYCLIAMTPKKLVAVRDPQGFRPLCIGRIGEDAIVFASETCALDSIGAQYLRDVKPGEIVIVDENGLRSDERYCGSNGHMCVFEYIYFARPDSVIAGASVHEARKRAGSFLALEYPVQADVVIGVPDSGLDAALGYAQQSGIPYGVGFIKNRYVGRTFIQPTQKQRENAVRIKLNALKSTVEGKRVVLVDDSIVRGTTSARIVKLLREAGAKEVHMRISAPPFKHPCFFGTDIGNREQLIACQMTIEEIRQKIDADSLGFLSVDHVVKIAACAKTDFCAGCFTGNYPVAVPEKLEKDEFMACVQENA